MADTPTFMGIPIVVDEDAPPDTATLVGKRRPIRIIRGKPKPAAGWLFDDKGRVRVGPCGHPLRPVEYDDIIGNPCRVCWLVKGEDAARISAYRREADTEGRRRLARARWGSTPKKMRSANSYKPGPTTPPYPDLHFDNMDAAFDACAPAIIAVAEVLAALARICPESSRTIRIRHGAFDEDDAIVIGDPWPQPNFQTIDDLHAMTQGFGSSMVAQQAAMSQNLLAYDTLVEAGAVMQAIDQAGAEMGAAMARAFTEDDD